MAGMVTDPIAWWAKQQPDEPAISFSGSVVTYRELDAWTAAVGADFAGRGLEVGDRVAVAGGNSLEWCVAALGALRAGAILVPLNIRLVTDELAYLVGETAPKLVLADAGRRDLMKEVASRGHDFELVDLESVAEFRGAAPSGFRRDADPEAPAVIVFTSGTTARPKGVIFSHESTLNFIFEWSLIEPDFTRGMRLLLVLPLAGAPGTLWGLVHVLAHGGTLFLETGFNPPETLKALVDNKITVFLGVPVIYEQLASVPAFEDADFSSLKVTHVGGARVPTPLLQKWQSRGVLLRQIYGLTEGGGSITVNDREQALTRPECCGRGGVFTRFKIVRPDGSVCDPGEPGEIFIKGPAVTPGYWNNEQATKDLFVDGWIRTGDLGVVDDEGYLKMVDRIKEMIISGGINISPIELENTIGALPQVEEVAVIPVADDKFGETPAAIIKLREPLEVTEIVAYCNDHLADFKVPRYVVLRDEPLPRMASGKIAKRYLREEYSDIPATHSRVR
jgi:fatty-acyl-CoA synthase